MSKLTDTAIRAAIAKPKAKGITKLPDGRGLVLWIEKGKSPSWRFRYRVGRVEKMLTLGLYPDVGLRFARERHDDARRLVAAKVDPSAKRQEEKATRANTFAAVADEFMDLKRKTLSASTWQRDRDQLVNMAGPKLGKRPIAEIGTDEVLAVLKVLEEKGLGDTAHRVRGVIGRVIRYAIASGRYGVKHDVTAALRGALAPVETVNYPSITDPVKVGALLRAIDGFDGMPATLAALRLAPLLFVRPGELRTAEWSEFDLEAKEPTWRIPGPKMKMRDEHVVPLSTQAVAILKEIQMVTGDGLYVFRAIGGGQRPLSENTLNGALRRLGYNTKTEMCAHGFRSMASTMLNEQGWHPDLIELQLAHKERNSVRAAYNKATRLAERRKMMQAWADYLDGLNAGSNIVTIKIARFGKK
jgi:integrase